MKNKLIILFAFFGLLAACEKDDICLEETTPKLVIRFFDKDNPTEYKKVVRLKVQIEGIDGDYTDESSITLLTDSIAIPIKVTDDMTRFHLIMNGADDDIENDSLATFTLSYRREDVFVSRSCGYKTLFYDAKTALIPEEKNWIESIKTVRDPQNILNESSDHVKIYH